MDGGSLDVYRKMPEHVLGRIAVAVVKGLTYLWSLKILHRDVKPSNMLVNTRGQVKLCDFGVSTQLVNSIAKTYVGTNAYMAPERISGEQYGIHSDVWSLGISFMELALGRFPYPQIQKNQGSLMPLQLLQCIVDEDSPVLPVGEFSEPFVHFITQCMRKQPKERPAPEELMGHPFIVQFNDGNAAVVSMWVCRALEERRSQQGPRERTTHLSPLSVRCLRKKSFAGPWLPCLCLHPCQQVALPGEPHVWPAPPGHPHIFWSEGADAGKGSKGWGIENGGS